MTEATPTPPEARTARDRGRRLLPAGRRGRLVLAGVVALAAVLLLVAVGLVRSSPPTEQTADVDPSPSASATPSTEPEPTASPTPEPARKFKAGDPPDRLRVPSIGLDAPLVPIAVDPAGVLTPPEDTDIVGWWSKSAHPGSPEGQTVLTGHTVSTGGGVMNELGSLEPDDRVEVRDDGRTVEYDVLEVFEYTREEVVTNARALFGQDRPGGRLVLVTCTDWDGEVYQSNIIVFAEPVETDDEDVDVEEQAAG